MTDTGIETTDPEVAPRGATLGSTTVPSGRRTTKYLPQWLLDRVREAHRERLELLRF